MTTAVNLRSDLDQLNDAELAQRLEDAWRDYETAEKRRQSWGLLAPKVFFPGERGPVRHPRVYRFFSALGSGGGSWLDLLFALAFSHKKAEPFLRGADPALAGHLSLCEIQDLVDEVERRVKERQAA
jgi:hypothetical protein